MEKHSKRTSVFERIQYVKEILTLATEELSSNDLRGCLCHIWYYKLGRRKELTSKERQIYDLLLKHGVHPKSAYRWFLLENAPVEVKQKLKEKKISLRDAAALSYGYRKMSATRAGKEIMEEMRTIIGGLQWNSHEGL